MMRSTRPGNVPPQRVAASTFPGGRPPVMPSRPAAMPNPAASPPRPPMPLRQRPQASPPPSSTAPATGAAALSAMSPTPATGQTTADSLGADIRAPLYSLWDRGEEFLLAVEIPGADPRKIDLELNATELTVQAGFSERLKRHRPGSYQGSVNLPASVEPDQASADYVEGMLEIILPKIRSLKKHKVKIACADVGQDRNPTEKSHTDSDDR